LWDTGSGAIFAYVSLSSMTVVASTQDRRSATNRFMYGWLSWLSKAPRSR
jgi:hypothetical protein